jgi:inosine-uridine nucleoside N-ribohydrolase
MIIDTDVGFDDLLAILALMTNPDVTIDAFTVVQGESDPATGAAMLLSMQEQLGFETAIPVYVAESSQPHHFPPDPGWFNQVKLLQWPAPKRFSVQTGSPAKIIAAAAAATTPVLAIGPLTNIAAAMAIPGTSLEVIAMGGTWTSKGNMPVGAEVAEANFWVDPPAAAAVCAAANAAQQLRLQLVTLDACEQVPIDKAFLHRCIAAWTPASKAFPHAVLALDVLRQIDALFLSSASPEPYYAYDPLAAMEMLDGTLVEHLLTRVTGGIVVDGATGHCSQATGALTIATGASAQAFGRLFIESFVR